MPLSTSQIREKYLQFFESKGHLRFPSHPIPVYDDPTLMFSVAGMAQFKRYFIGDKPDFGARGVATRVVTAQKCIRIGDIENVGRTARHCSLFEMMGNFSFDSYFKKEAIEWAWEFITAPEWLGFDPNRIYVTIYKDDNEAFTYWTQNVGLEPSRINRFDADENFWPQNAPSKGPNGPCGPCSEIFYDRGEAYGADTWQDYATNPESARFLEFWNLVFPGYNRSDGEDGTGHLEDLGRRNIDTGLGLIRAAAISQGVPDLYGTDDFVPLLEKIVNLSGKPYGGANSLSHRVIAEHLRMVSMTLADGVTFGTGEREYVVRKVMRRAIRHGYLLGIREPMLYQLVPIVAATLGVAYPEMVSAQDSVSKQIEQEEALFLKTLERGIERLETAIAGKTVLTGDQAFILYGTYGFPLDLTKEICEERGISVDEDGYKTALKEDQTLARAGSKYGKKDGVFGGSNVLDGMAATDFVGYTSTHAHTQVIGLLLGHDRLESATEGQHLQAILEATPFYAESGGQIGDKGVLEWTGGRAAVLDTQKNAAGVFVHDLHILRGTLSVGTALEARVEAGTRSATERHHTATHLLQAALRATLGTHVQQKGSLVTPTQLRFDFTHGEPVSSEDLRRVEQLVNRWIQADFAVTWQNMPLDEARKTGAMALFGTKYGDTVRVVSVDGDVSSVGILESSVAVSSKELCGGTHVPRTGNIGAFIITSEEGVAAGVRRLEALCGEAATTYMRQTLDRVQGISRAINATPESLPERFEKMQDELRGQQKEIAVLKQKLVQAQTSGNTSAETLELNGLKVVRMQLDGVEGAALKTAADDLMDKTRADLVVVGSGTGLVVKASKEANAKGIKAGDVIRKLAQAGGGNGGGSPAMAQAGGVQNVGVALAALEGIFADTK